MRRSVQLRLCFGLCALAALLVAGMVVATGTEAGAAVVAAGAAAGVLWERLWHPTAGLNYDNQWYLEPAGPDIAFQGVARSGTARAPRPIAVSTRRISRCSSAW